MPPIWTRDSLATGALALLLGWLTYTLIHQAIRHSGDPPFHFVLRRIIWLYCKLLHGWRSNGPLRLPPTGPALVVCNHTSTADPLFLQCGSQRVISFLMAREYMSLHWFRPVFELSGVIPVNRTGQDTAATRAAIRALEEGRVVGIFPEGRIRLDPHGVAHGRPGAAMIALRTRVPVYPAFILRRLRSNSVLRGLFQPCKTRVYYGRPLDLTRFYDQETTRELLREATEYLMCSIAALKPDCAGDSCSAQ
jgi:1-acyl-sn-glycerol-3-phosphate acyltransferase